MAGTSPNGEEEESSSSEEIGIPTGLNRIKTRRVLSNDNNLSSKPGASYYKLTDSRSHGVSRPHSKQKLKINGSKEGLRRGKRIARWFTSHLFKGSDQGFNDIPRNTKSKVSEVKAVSKEGPYPPRNQLHKVGKHLSVKESSPESRCSSRGREVLKSFSHVLGPKEGIRPAGSAHPRAHSYNDLKELLGSLRSRFDAAKEVVNKELACFAWELKEILLTTDPLSPEGQKMAEELLSLAEQCIKMTSLEFRSKCKTAVQDLTEKRKQCQIGLLKWLLSRMLFILTRCTRLLHFERDNEPIDEKCLNIFKKCLDSIPCVEMSWVSNPGISDTGSGYGLSLTSNGKNEMDAPNLVSDPSKATSKNDSMVSGHDAFCRNSQIDQLSNVQQCENFMGDLINRPTCGSLNEREGLVDGSDSVICRICEEAVPTSYLEFHSYICAYADKCDLKCVDVDDRLMKFAEMLEQITSRNLTVHASYDSPDTLRTQTTDSAVPSEGCSPSMISEWRSKGVEGMFEDIHEMDTAFIDDSHLTTTVNLKDHLASRLNHCGPPSSTGSMTSLSSTNTPRAGHFDFFWLEHNNPSELEDVEQMIDLVDIARCVAGTDLSVEGSHEFLLARMEDLQDILQRSKIKALVVDTFGSRMESLLREKFLLACELIDAKNLETNGKGTLNSKLLLDHVSQSSTTSTPAHPFHKERTSIDDFEIIKPISRGAFGKVFLARKRITGDSFAIKVLKKLDMIRKNDIENILAERNILITVRNPFVVRFFYSFTSRDHLYLVMEYLNGGDLYSLLQKVGCLEEDVARIYIAELVLALEYLHSLGIVHRDLKPDNILIAHDGHIKLTDFGLSKIGLMNSTGDIPGPETDGNAVHGQQNEQTKDSSQRSAVGTPDYLAPEILLGTEHGNAADWWSVGIILFEFITGIPPFAAERPEIIFDNILNRKVPWPSVPNDMSCEAQDLIDRFLVHDPHQRLGAKGSSEVKAHSFFKGVNWDTLALQKAAFVPQPDGLDDTSYFVSRHTQLSTEMPDDLGCSDSASDMSESYSNSGVEKMDECGDLEQFDSSPLDLSLMNFSFKNLSQLASINRDVLLQSWKDQSKCSSPASDL